jgi:zinc/manganese transport system substrate-binding protein
VKLVRPSRLRGQNLLRTGSSACLCGAHLYPVRMSRPLMSRALMSRALVCRAGLVALALATTGLLSGCAPASASAKRSDSSNAAKVIAVGAENEYANVISQVGGAYVDVSAIMSNPNTDPHEFEASASVAVEVSQAQLIVQNGVGYDSFMNKIESASAKSSRKVIVAQDLLGFPNTVFNPHLWYDPRTMPLVASAVASALSSFQPAHKAFFEANAKRFDDSLQPWLSAIKSFKAAYPGTRVAVTEPVADYMLEAAGAKIMTPESLQSAIMNGTDPSPQDISTEQGLIQDHRVKVLLYNQQVTDSLTSTFLAAAKKAKIPVVGVYETMPVPGYDYQSWMSAEVIALRRAVDQGISTVRL